VTVAENANTVTAWNVAVKDLLGADETLISGSEHTNEGSITETGTGFVLNLGSLTSADAPITLTYQARIADTAYDKEAIINTASLSYDGAPAGGITYTGSASQTFNTHIVDQFSKTLVTTSQNGGDLVIPGETVKFDLTATLGTGTQNLVFNDTLPTGLTAVSAKVISEGQVIATVPVNTVVTPTGNTLSLNLGKVVTPGSDRTAPNNQVTVEVTATVNATTALSTILTNTGTLVATTPSGAPSQTLTASAPVDVVQPGTISAFVFLDTNCTGT
jgi:fimbrial isopeptide formation D2 family protein